MEEVGIDVLYETIPEEIWVSFQTRRILRKRGGLLNRTGNLGSHCCHIGILRPM